MNEEKINQLKKDLYELTFKQKQEIIIYILDLINEDYEDLKEYE